MHLRDRVPLNVFQLFSTRSGSNPLFGRAHNVIAKNEKNEISEEKDAQSHEDDDELFAQFHG